MKQFKKGEIPDLSYQLAVKKPIPLRFIQMREPFEVETMHGTFRGKAGDYLMVGMEGELYPCDKTIFEKNYEVLQPASSSL